MEAGALLLKILSLVCLLHVLDFQIGFRMAYALLAIDSLRVMSSCAPPAPYLLISLITVAIFPMVYIVLTFQHPIFRWSLGVRRDLLCGLIVLLASLRLSPGIVIVASPQWRKLSSGMSQVTQVRSTIVFVTEVVSVASCFL